MSGRQQTTSDSDSTPDDQEVNAVDFLLAKFPPEEAGIVDVDPVEVKNEPEDVAALAAEQNGNEPIEADGAQKELRFDPDLGTVYGFTELNGYRWYFLEGEAVVCLKPDDINALKNIANTKGLDSKFVSTLLSAVFGDDILKESSAGGKKSNYNNVSHNALERSKLEFIKGFFKQRVSSDDKRMKPFIKFVNKKCNNLRRSVINKKD